MSSNTSQTAAPATNKEEPAPAQENGASPTRVYRGRTVEELIPKIQAELGDDAIVVRRNKGLTGGVGGFFQRPFIEIEARGGQPGVDLFDEPSAAPALPAALEGFASAPQGAGSPLYGQNGAVLPDIAADSAAGSSRGTRSSAPNGLDTSDQRLDDPFAAALAEAEAGAAVLAVEPTVQPDLANDVPGGGHTDRRPITGASAPSGRARSSIERSLVDVGLGEELVKELIEAAAAHVLPLMPSRSGLAPAVRSALRQCIPTCPPPPASGAMVAVVGPGGSGRTSCCQAILETYRTRSTVPAVCAEFVATEARGRHLIVLGPDIREPTPITHPQVARGLRRARGEGLLLLDMPPVSPADADAIRALAALLDGLQPDRVIVALPATLGAKAAAQLLGALRPLHARSLAITHADETDQLGVAVQAACTFDLAPEYMLERGRGSEGLTALDPTYLANRLLP